MFYPKRASVSPTCLTTISEQVMRYKVCLSNYGAEFKIHISKLIFNSNESIANKAEHS